VSEIIGVDAVDNPRLLAEVALEYIEEHPNEWYQGTWRCQTACCFAGHVVVSAGGLKWAAPDGSEVNVPAGTMFVSDLAQQLLGLSPAESWTLFRASNKIRDIRAAINRLWPK
jgi:hypothetical protein